VETLYQRRYKIEIILAILISLSIYLYWLGGQEFAHTLFRDIGCSLCIIIISLIMFKYQYQLLPLLLLPFGFAIGDHDKFYWTGHALLISLTFLFFSIVFNLLLQFFLMLFIVVGGTYLVSRFLNKNGYDVFLRGFLYSTIPFWFLLK